MTAITGETTDQRISEIAPNRVVHEIGAATIRATVDLGNEVTRRSIEHLMGSRPLAESRLLDRGDDGDHTSAQS